MSAMSSQHSEPSEHILPATLYWGIWLLLIILTFVTAWVANIDLGRFNTVVALVIATFKASVVVLFGVGKGTNQAGFVSQYIDPATSRPCISRTSTTFRCRVRRRVFRWWRRSIPAR